MEYELTAICDACGVRRTVRLETLDPRFPARPLPKGWTHVHEGGRPGTLTPEIGIACSRACLSKARTILRASPAPARTGPVRERW